MFASNIRPPELHVDSLESMAASFSSRSIAGVKASLDAELDKEVWAATLAEVEGGTLDGPFDVSELPRGHLVSPDLAYAKGRRTYDLRKAYRQLGVNEAHFKFSWIAAWSPDDECVKLFRMKGLPFGGTASVASFLRISRALKELGIHGGLLMWFLFKAMGWVLSEDPDKDKGFSTVFSALGVEFDLSDVGAGVLRVGNTAKRRAELSELVRGFLDADRISVGDAESLRSRLTFAEGQIFGRSAKLALRAIGSPVRSGHDASPLTADIRFGLQWMLERIVNAPPREVTTADEPPLLLFVDGACESATDKSRDLITSVGAILIDSNGVGLHFFGLHLPDEITSEWGRGGRQLVFEAEILPYLLALHCWQDTIADRHVLVFIDNDGARHSWIRGGADSKYALQMIHAGTLMEARSGACPYFCRVPTASNVADGPSRLDFAICVALGARETHIPFETLRNCALGVEAACEGYPKRWIGGVKADVALRRSPLILEKV
eukprot:s3318_g8.t1